MRVDAAIGVEHGDRPEFRWVQDGDQDRPVLVLGGTTFLSLPVNPDQVVSYLSNLLAVLTDEMHTLSKWADPTGNEELGDGPYPMRAS